MNNKQFNKDDIVQWVVKNYGDLFELIKNSTPAESDECLKASRKAFANIMKKFKISYSETFEILKKGYKLYNNMNNSRDKSLGEGCTNNLDEARFNGIALPSEDGFYGMDEELCEESKLKAVPTTVVACYNDDDGYDQAVRYGLPSGTTFDELENYLYDCGMVYVDIQEDTLKAAPNANYTEITFVEFCDPKDFGYSSEEDLNEKYTTSKSAKIANNMNESIESDHKTIITEAMNNDARKYGYRNYQEYLNSNK